jgi:hypothetical protein
VSRKLKRVSEEEDSTGAKSSGRSRKRIGGLNEKRGRSIVAEAKNEEDSPGAKSSSEAGRCTAARGRLSSEGGRIS